MDIDHNPFKKTAKTDSKENIPISSSKENSPPIMFQSVLSRPSHVISSHSSAINFQKTITETLFDQPDDYLKSDFQETLSNSRETLSRIPSPIKSVPRTLGLGRKLSQSSLSDSKPAQSNQLVPTNKPAQTNKAAQINKPVQIKDLIQTSSGNKWISTQSSQKSKKVLQAGSKKHPIKIGLTPTSNPKKQRTLNFSKRSDNEAKGETLSKYF